MTMKKAILGISAYYHDSAAAILVDGQIVAAAQEERFTRKKHDSSFPIHACRYVLQEAGIDYNDLAAVAFYDKPFLKFERLLETYHAFAPSGFLSFLSAIPVWIKEKLFMRRLLAEHLAELGGGTIPIYYPEHHLSHAASAFYPSPFPEAAILTVDGVGEWATTTIGRGRGKEIEILRELQFPHSVGLLYSAFTYYTGFAVNSGEYKLMGLAPYGDPDSQHTADFKKKITTDLVDIRKDGSILLNMDYFEYATGLKMANENKWEHLFGVPRRKAESEISQVYMDMALAIQQVTEEIVLRLACTARQLTGSKYLVLAGGVALNCVANGKLLKAGTFENLWIQPAAGDAGGAVGAAYAVWHIHQGNDRGVDGHTDAMAGSYLGPEFSGKEIRRALQKYDAKSRHYEDFQKLASDVAAKLADGNVVGWLQGRMEFGPRALGNRSILGDARNPEMQKKLNLKIKYREGFRPFAPSVLEEDIEEYFDLDRQSPYMLLVAPIREDKKIPLPDGYSGRPLYERLYFLRSDLPSITHIDYSARIQSVSRQTNARYWELIHEFKGLTGYGVIVNTSFNVRGEPIVCTPEDAYRCFMRTEMDFLVVGNYLLDKKEQPGLAETDDWRTEFKLD
jgi:carbamoyltransferase